MPEPSRMEKIRYRFDNFMSRGTISLILGLAVLSIVIITIVAIVVVSLGIAPGDGEKISFFEAFWLSLMRTLDAGTMGGDTGWGFRIAMFFVTIGGVFVISTLIGILTSGIEGKMDELRKGRSRVIEKNQTVILGWSDQVFTIIPELVEANSNQPDSCIVIMGDCDKVDMEDAIRDKVGDTGKTRIVCRSGNPVDMTDLQIVSLNTSKSILVLSPETETPDAEVIKTVVAILNLPDRRPEPYHIVAELRDPKNYEIAQIVGKEEVEWIQLGGLISRIIAQTCRQSGLSTVYTELLDFGGDEIYFTHQPSLEGKSYRETLNRFDKNAIMGIAPEGGGAVLNPPMDTVLKSGDKLIVIAEDDDRIFLNTSGVEFDESVFSRSQKLENTPEETLILGWNWRGCNLIQELDAYVPDKSEVLIVHEDEATEKQIRELKHNIKHQSIKILSGDTTSRAQLDDLNLAAYDHIIVLSDSDRLPPQQADSKTLMTLLHLRNMAEIMQLDFSIVSEMQDVRNRNLAEVTRADDFIVSDKLVSLIMAQVSENKGLNAVFTDLFDPEGAEIYLKPAHHYILPGKEASFASVVEAAARKGETAIGYKLDEFSHDVGKGYGVHVNPAKSEKIRFSDLDKVIVLAEN
ncbi:MAG: potassium transporter TrkA [Leptolinea sp.]|jgi:voltage-gated potassium channel Kch|nr:potassium transporter TrkA [Leptolinea sp.]